MTLITRKLPYVLALISIGIAHCSVAQDRDFRLTATDIHSDKECHTILAEFNWVCQEFSHSGWERTYGDPFWAESGLRAFRHDLDLDGRDDVILEVGRKEKCDPTDGCKRYYLFGDQPAAEHPHAWGMVVYSDQPVVPTENGELGLPLGTQFSRILPVSEYKSHLISSPQIPIVSKETVGSVQEVGGDIRLTGQMIRSPKACMSQLAEFNWVCAEFERETIVDTYSRHFWDSGQVVMYRHDLNGDDIDDVILSVNFIHQCDPGRTYCPHFFLFGNPTINEQFYRLDQMGDSQPVLRENNGKMTISIVANRLSYHRIDEIYELTNDSKYKPIIR